jgi:hypothetical protein
MRPAFPRKRLAQLRMAFQCRRPGLLNLMGSTPARPRFPRSKLNVKTSLTTSELGKRGLLERRRVSHRPASRCYARYLPA